MALITTLGASFILFLLTKVAKIETQKAAIIVSFALLLFFSYGHVYYVISTYLPSFNIGHRHLLFLWILLTLVLGYSSRKLSEHLSISTNFLNIMATSLVILSLLQIIFYEVSTRSVWKPSREFEGGDEGAGRSSFTPDIYYIIFDTYAGASTLEEFYGFENGEFTSWLENRGFYLAEASFSNYSTTALSLASSLNMDYIDKFKPMLAETVTDKDYEILKQMIENNNVMWFLKSKGYSFIFLGSAYGVTQGNRFADFDIKCGYVDETVGRIIQSTLIWPFADKFQIIAKDDRNKRLCMFKKLGELHAMKGQKFVFAHIIAPHSPFLFDADGNPIRVYKSDPEHTKGYYVDQLIFVNKKIKEMVDEILSNSKIEPIIILQGDTGPPYGFTPEEAIYRPTEEIYQQSTRILNAYYLPENGAKFMYKDISPVNTFRMIFNIYFRSDIPLLDERSYFLTGDFPSRFIDVTESVDYH
jgi:hypothetical protein